MKIEKISNAQIRCTLNKTDLSTRQIKISELAYGTEKAQELFKDMMAKASDEFGFEAENVPLMIEAIPLSGDSIMLVITKVDNPDELDDKFASIPKQNVRKFKKKESDQEEVVDTGTSTDIKQLIYMFKTLDEVTKIAKIILPIYDGVNSLYKNEQSNEYYLVLRKSEDTQDAFVGLHGLLSEYGKKITVSHVMEAFLQEHYDVIIKEKAIQVLSKL